MCGIAGAISKNKVHEMNLQCATDILQHRGPDSGGYYTAGNSNVFLGHRRLSIIDLSNVANQPMLSANDRYSMVYNGEVYNFNELRNKLPGHSWRTHSDTEVILELFSKYGVESFSWLNGMFALAIHDKEKNEVIICRDQIGIKPLYYYHSDEEIIFASELKVINEYIKKDGRKLKINNDAIPYFLHLGFIPEPLTIYQQVHKFPSGSYGIVDVQNINLAITKYWSASDHFLNQPIFSEADAFSQYKKALYASVESQMVSDVPLGTFLSGGIDSSLVTAVASKMAPKRVESFSIGFHDPKYDESIYAEAIAKHLDTKHHTFKVSADDILEMVPSLNKVYDEPFADSSAFPTMLVSRLARKHVTVTLSGDGGDEMFQGYGMYTWANRLDNPFFKLFRKPAYLITQQMDNRRKRGGKLFNYPSAQRIHTHIFSQEQYMFGEDELNNVLLNPKFNFTELNNLHLPRRGNAAERQAYWDLTHYLKDDLLVKVDRASMQYSLETRVPLLDLRLIELSLNIDYNLKVRQETGTKYLMKKALYELVPKSYFDRPKRGFSIPLREWLLGPLHYLINDYLNKDIVTAYNYVNFGEVEKLLQQLKKGEDFVYGRIWLLIVLHWWLAENDN
jgi:asparagine synthase (glutamine-hydrolysing)